ncbi:MAG: orotate phosphoribosyltransferase [Candidatus Daviesbacteria bacterium]|nr:orotate phosphoribosyltransferase [Candidatus Daviesbacteria bacterium]
MDKTSQKVAKILLEVSAVSLNPKKPYKYDSGILSPVYTDCRILISFPKLRKTIRNLYIEEMKKTGVKFDVVAGTATAGIPHAAWIAEKLNIPMVYVRGQAKSHGKGNQVEGVIKKGQKVAVIEDLISTAESSAETARAVRALGGKVSHVFSITTYQMKKSQDNLKINKLKLVSLTNFGEIVTQAQKMGYLNKEEMAVVLDWAKDTVGWGKKMGFE